MNPPRHPLICPEKDQHNTCVSLCRFLKFHLAQFVLDQEAIIGERGDRVGEEEKEGQGGGGGVCSVKSGHSVEVVSGLEAS